MKEADLQAIIVRDEEVSVEFKLESEKQSHLAEVLGAMANSRGGWLLVGVNDNGEIIGVSRPKTVIDRLYSAAGSVEPSLLGRVTVENVETADGRTVIAAHVPDGLLAIHAVGGVYRLRIGSYNKILTFDQAQALAYRRGILHYEQSPVQNLGIEDLEPDEIEAYLSHRLKDYSPKLYHGLSIFEKLRNLGCAIKEEERELPTVNGALFFSAAPDFYVPGAQIIAARFAGTTTDKPIDRATLRGPLRKIIQDAANFVEKNIRHSIEFPDMPGESMAAQEKPEYPVEAYREMIVNMVAHRDYHNPVPAHLMIFEDRIVAENPGGLLPGLSLESIENHHRPRNPRLTEMLYTLGYVERFGSGISRMKHTMQEKNLPAPLFEADEGYFRVTLRNSFGQARSAPPVSPPVIAPPTEPADNLRETSILQRLPLIRLKRRQIEGLRYLIRNGKLTNTAYRQATGLAEDATLADLKELMELDIIHKIGTSGRSVYYILNPLYEKEDEA